MGCDIHAYVDWDTKGSEWTDSLGSININRNYALFAVLAGVRDDYRNPVGALIEPKGVPDKMSFWVENDLFLHVVKDDEYENERRGGNFRICPASSAEVWAARSCHLSPNGYKNDSKNSVFHPDWHNHSWMNIDELSKALRKYTSKFGCRAPSDTKAVLAAMRSLKKDGYEPRFVFWFDN